MSKQAEGFTVTRLSIYPSVLPRRILIASLKSMCVFHKVLNQQVDWVAWASLQLYSLVPRPHPYKMGKGLVTLLAFLGCADSAIT